MNKSGIEWCHHTWNPVTGCLHGCKYCYAKAMTARFSGDVRRNKMAKDSYRTLKAADGIHTLYILDEPMKNETGQYLVYPFGFEPTYHRYRLNMLDKLKMGNNIFVGAMSDIFGAWVPDAWIREVINTCEKYPMHNYLFLTKNPQRYEQYGVPTGKGNMWFGTTVTRRIEIDRVNYLQAECKRFVSIEPLLEDIQPEQNYLLFKHVDWIILGAETGKRKDKTIPEFEWIKKIVLEADGNGIPVFMKESLIPIIGEENMRREFPPELERKTMSEKMKTKLYGNCCNCNKRMKKSDLVKLMAKRERKETQKQFAYLCTECFENLCNGWKIEIPELEYRGEKNE